MALSFERRPQARRPGLTELAARKYVESHGGDALSILQERAHLAEERGHRVAAAAWHDLAEVAGRILAASDGATAAVRGAGGGGWRDSMPCGLRPL
jgi:hypothetical protein